MQATDGVRGIPIGSGPTLTARGTALAPYTYTPSAAPYQGQTCAIGNSVRNEFIMQVAVFR